MKILGLLKADASTEAGVPPSPELMDKMGKFIDEVAKAGVLLATDGLTPTSQGKRVQLSNGKVTVLDGPFTGAKEQVSAYALYQVKSMAEAIEWTTRFLKVLGQGECELRPIFEPEDLPSAPDAKSAHSR